MNAETPTAATLIEQIRIELAPIDYGLRRGDSPSRALSAARLLQTYELMFWDAVSAAEEA